MLGSWTLDGRASETTNFLEDMQSNTAVVFGEDDNFDSLPDDTEVIVLALGEDYLATGENRCVADISLNCKQVELIKKAKATGKKTVGVIFCGRPIAIQEVADNLNAVLYAWHCGSETANAACSILLGRVNPSGKTTATFPRKPTHIPLYYNVTSSGRPSNCYYGEGLKVCYIDGPADPYYPFGYGLSYTSFEYSAPKADNVALPLEQIDGIALTNHYQKSYVSDNDFTEFVNRYISEFCSAKRYGEKIGCRVFFGIEITMEKYPNVHMLIYGVKPEILLKYPDLFDSTQEQLYKTVKACNGVMVQAHPFRNGTTVMSTNFLDGVEINCHPLYKKTYSTELMDIAQRNNLFLTCGGDYHADTYRPKCGMVLPDDIESDIDLGIFLSSNKEKRICVQETDSSEIVWLTTKKSEDQLY